MTQVQKDTLEKAFEVLGEHFDGFVLAVHIECDDEVGEAHEFHCQCSGGYTLALGLAQRAKLQVLEWIDEDTWSMDEPEDEEDEEDG